MTVTVTGNSTIRKSKQPTVSRQQSKRQKSNSPASRNSSRRLRCTSFTIGTTVHRDLSPARSSSPSPNNLSRSTSPAASIANFIRPIFPPCIQVKEPLSPRFSRASSTIMTHDRHCTPPITNNINASTASARTTLLIDHSPGYDNHNSLRNLSNVPENCFEPEAYRNSYSLNRNEPKKLSLSDPTLNQTRTRSSPHEPKAIVNHAPMTDEYFSTSSFHPTTTTTTTTTNKKEEEEVELIPSDDGEDETGDLSTHEEKRTTIDQCRRTHRKYSSPRHRLMTCTSGVNDSLIKLTPATDAEHGDSQDETSFYIMQNRPP